ncbi:MAG: hypothetical protein JXR97_10560 [Planctomycetes bacterium]|nr:hypothetical protein [Planctomycetota bacterium]
MAVAVFYRIYSTWRNWTTLAIFGALTPSLGIALFTSALVVTFTILEGRADLLSSYQAVAAFTLFGSHYLISECWHIIIPLYLVSICYVWWVRRWQPAGKRPHPEMAD